MLLPMVAFDRLELAEANALLQRWGHAMGPCERPNFGAAAAHALFHEGEPIAVAITAPLVREAVAGGGSIAHDRSNTIELARLCAARRDLNRVVLRLWREFIFPPTGKAGAISYQDAALHSGDLYRFDGWERLPDIAHSGTDARSGRKGRNKWVWRWPRAC